MSDSHSKPDQSIELLRQEVIEKLGWGSVEKWHSSMFQELSKKIFEHSQVLLSVATLKRFFGTVQHDGSPSIKTLDALSVFTGYDNWRVYKTHLFKTKKKRSAFKLSSNAKRFIQIVGMSLMIVVLFIAFDNTKFRETAAVGSVEFSSRPVSQEFPNSVIFDFDLKGMESDHMVIQQYWDPSKTITIEKDQRTATGIYYFPGYFRAKLIVGENSIMEHDLFLKSDGWLGMIEYDPVPKYFGLDEESNLLHSPNEIEEEIRSSEKPLWTSYHYVDNLGMLSGDNFLMHCTVRNTYDDKWATCHSSYIYLLGTEGAMIIPFSKLGCSSDNDLMLSDLYLDGKKNDLSNFGVGLEEFKKIDITCKEREVSISVDNTQVYSGKYQESMGRLVGVRFKFKGLGEVKDFSILDNNGNAIVGLNMM